MVTINREWLDTVDNKATDYENGRIGILDFSNDELHYLIYWNFGYSGITITEYTRNAEAELVARGLAFDSARAEVINDMAENYYGSLK